MKPGQARSGGAAKPFGPDGLWTAVAEPLPPEPKPKGGPPTGILFVLHSGLPREMLFAEMGCGSGMSSWRRLRDRHKAVI